MIEFTVLGRARPQGSKKAFKHPSTGRIILTEQSKQVGPWRENVRGEALRAGLGDPVDGPVMVHVVAVFARPKSHYRTGKNAHLLKDSAPATPTTRSVGDIDKLARAVLDALTGVVFMDDSQVVALVAAKRWGWPERCVVAVDDHPSVTVEDVAA